MVRTVATAKISPALDLMRASGGVLQRKCACGQHATGGERAECGENNLQRQKRRGPEPTTVPPIVGKVLRSPGLPLDNSTRAYMESRFGHDFSQVRVHTDTLADQSAKAVDAVAFTVGKDVVFQRGQYEPATSQGRELLTHELVHTLQQDTVSKLPSSYLSISKAGDAEEREAEAVAKASFREAPGPHVSDRGAQLARKENDADGTSNILEDSLLAESGKNQEEASEPASAACALADFSASNFTGSAVKADVDFVEALERINRHAISSNVKVHVTSSFRTSTNVKGAIVKPATMSNHLAGHAIDMNLWYGVSKEKLCASGCLAGILPGPVGTFIDAIREDSRLRWGGDFSDRDPVHIDDHLNVNPEAWKARYVAVQKARKEGCG